MIARCAAEIARAGAYQGPDGIGALMGQTDWMVEMQMIREEIEMLNRGAVWVSRTTKAWILVLAVSDATVEYKHFADASQAQLPRETFLARFRPHRGKLL